MASLVIEVYSFHSKLSECCSDMTDEMFGVITTVNAERVWRCNQPSQVSQTETSKKRSQSFCLTVFLPPASLSWQHLWASITHPSQSVMWMVTLFLSATKTLHVFGFDYQFLQLGTVSMMFQYCGPLWHPIQVCGWRSGPISCCKNPILACCNVETTICFICNMIIFLEFSEHLKMGSW